MRSDDSSIGRIQNICFKFFPWVLVIICSFLNISKSPAQTQENKPKVFYSGVFLAGSKNDANSHSLFLKNQAELNQKFEKSMKLLNERGLAFELLFGADMEERKKEIEAPYSLAIVITRDDVLIENFITPAGNIYKTYVNAGLVVIVFRTDLDMPEGPRNTIIYSVPLVGYARHNKAKSPPTEKEINDLFLTTATLTLEKYLANRLSRLGLRDIQGVVKEVTDNRILINVGSLAGLEEGQNITFMKSGKNDARGVVEKLDRVEAIVRITSGNLPEKGGVVRAPNTKGQSFETYQVNSFRISSKKGKEFFSEELLAMQVAQWVSDSLADDDGKVVLPPRISGEWDKSATGESFKLLAIDNKEHHFSLPPPKYTVTLDLSGVASKKVESNNINEIWLHQVWLKVDIPQKKISQEFTLKSTKSVVPGSHSYEEKDEIFDLIHELAEKIGREGKL